MSTAIPRPSPAARRVGALLTLSVALLIAACSGTAPGGTASGAPSPSPQAPTPAPSLPSGSPPPASPSAVPSAPGQVIPTDSIATVVTNDLRVRSKPEVSDASQLLTPLLQDDQRVFVVAGPVEGSGYQWYLVAPIADHIEDVLPFGWVADADKDTGEPWLAPDDESCPSVPATYGEFADVSPLVALSCFGDREISFAARVIRPEATCGVDPGWGIVPAWLGAVCHAPEFIAIDPAGRAADFETITEPGFEAPGVDPGVEPQDAVDVIVSGAYDHPESRSCELEVSDPGARPNVTPEEAVLICRSHFVAASIEPAG